MKKAKRPLLKKINPAELLFFHTTEINGKASFYQQAKLTLHADALKKNSLDVLITTAD